VRGRQGENKFCRLVFFRVGELFADPGGQRCGSATARLLRLGVRIPPGGIDIYACCDCCVLSGRGCYEGQTTCPDESYRLCYVIVCDLETSRVRSHGPLWGTTPEEKNLIILL
jgi:hypothetical protein